MAANVIRFAEFLYNRVYLLNSLAALSRGDVVVVVDRGAVVTFVSVGWLESAFFSPAGITE